MASTDNQIFFVGQKAFIQNDKGEVLVLIDENIGLDLPGGKVQEGETDITESLKREVREETNLEIEVGNVFYTWIFKYPLSENVPDKRTNGNLYLVGYTCKLLGGDFTISEEHLNHKWIGKDDLSQFDPSKGHYKALEYFFKNN